MENPKIAIRKSFDRQKSITACFANEIVIYELELQSNAPWQPNPTIIKIYAN